MNDHEKRELVDKLTAIAREYASTQQLRARIAYVLLPALPREDPHAEHWKALAKAAETIGASPNCGPEQAAEFCRAIDRLSSAIMGEYDSEYQECAANGSGPCNIKPDGPRGELQCVWCGEPPRRQASGLAKELYEMLGMRVSTRITGALE